MIIYLRKDVISGEYSRKLHEAVVRIKNNEERKTAYMNMYSLMDEYYLEGQRKGIRKGKRAGKRAGKRVGRRIGREEGILLGIRQLMTKMNMSSAQAMEFLDIPSADQKKYLSRL